MKINHQIQLDYNDVLIKPSNTNIHSRKDVNLIRKIHFPISKQIWEGVPIIAANMDTIGTYEVYKVLVKHKIITCFHKFYNVEDLEKMELDPEYFMISTGINDDDLERLKTITEKIDVKFICIDVANGYLENLINFCNQLRNLYPTKIIVAGNVVCNKRTKELIKYGKVDIVKVGIGSGSACLTRTQTGIGVPQLSAVDECATQAHELNSFIIGDGGITCAGDISKGFGAGSDFIMIGGLFSGHDENPGEIIEENNKKYKIFYGMSSKTSMEKNYGKMDTYKSSEGRSCKIPYKGSIENTLNDLLGGIRSTCTYTGTKNIKELPNNCNFIRVNNQLNKLYEKYDNPL